MPSVGVSDKSNVCGAAAESEEDPPPPVDGDEAFTVASRAPRTLVRMSNSNMRMFETSLPKALVDAELLLNTNPTNRDVPP